MEKERQRVIAELKENEREFQEAEAREARERANALDEMNNQAGKQQDEIIRSREILERLSEEQNKPASSSSAPAADLFNREVSDGIRVRGGMIYGNWLSPVMERMDGMTPNREARLI